ncbi:PCC domain-containing protein [Oricola thermophila]|uniref:DUF296 domain-containing protein n=1 Tax=Oricola thermophila TaxID=2742145 RepID=A0A6N1V821_9HYPH|nr:DUF296 domain-containing protein [Oricola thermophila]QKV17034.1 DUF296 domain-containing protein [Oricola thermophila]
MSGRSIRHPGPPAHERHTAVACRAQALSLTLEPGKSFNTSLADAFSSHGFEAGYALLDDVPMKRLDYVVPAESPDESHAAWYSETFAPSSGGTICSAGLHLGRRDGEPFLHCHGLWELQDEGLRMGHLLPFEAELREATKVRAVGISGALFDATDDAETNFRLFSPQIAKASDVETPRRAVLATVRPNQDICEAIEAICDEHGFEDAEVLGIGSLVGADFEGGGHVSSYATEVLIRDGQVTKSKDGPRARLDIALVGIDGAIAEGVLLRGTNPVCVTFELLILG